MTLPVALFLLPLVAALLIAVTDIPSRKVALLATGFNLILGVVLLFQFPWGAAGFHEVVRIPLTHDSSFLPIAFHFGVDGISLPLVILTLLVSFSAVAVSPETIKRSKEFFAFVLLISSGAIGAFTALDLFFMYSFHEIALIPTFLLIGIWGSHNRKQAATEITLYLTAGSLVLLAGLLWFYFKLPVHLRTLDIVFLQQHAREIHIAASSQGTIFILLLIGFGTLVSLWPFHSWAAPAYSSAPPAAAMLHAGVLKKFGIYGLIRLAVPLLPQGSQLYVNLLLVLLVFNILWVGYITIAQKDLGLVLGFSSVMHMGDLFLGLAAVFGLTHARPWAVIPLAGVVLLMVGHGLSTALLFGLAGEIRTKLGTLNIPDLGGLATKTPRLAFLFIIGAMASIGLPGLANFSGEILIFFGGWKAFPFATSLAILGVIISAIYMLRAVRNVFFGGPSWLVTERAETLKDLTSIWPYVVLLVPLFVIGLWPKAVLTLAQPAIKGVLGL